MRDVYKISEIYRKDAYCNLPVYFKRSDGWMRTFIQIVTNFTHKTLRLESEFVCKMWKIFVAMHNKSASHRERILEHQCQGNAVYQSLGIKQTVVTLFKKLP